jgi:hypothetical protein
LAAVDSILDCSVGLKANNYPAWTRTKNGGTKSLCVTDYTTGYKQLKIEACPPAAGVKIEKSV